MEEMQEFSTNKLENIEVASKDDMKSYIARLVNDLRNDLEVYEQIKALNLTVGEVRDNIAKLTDFKDDYNYCKKCPGLDKCAKHIPHIKMSIKKEGTYLSTSYEPCEIIMEKIRLDNKYMHSDFPDEWKRSSLETLDLSVARRPVVKQFAKVLNDTTDMWIYVHGNHKIGKSFLLVTFANEFATMNKGQVAVFNTVTMLQNLADLSYRDKEEFGRQMVLISNVPLLVLDNFGEEYKNEYIRDQILIPLLNEREHKSRTTMFASSFTIDEIQKMYAIGKSGGSIRARQLGDILRSMAKEYDLTGASIYRK
ncbi:MAG: hypothetical protein K6E11_04025 [Bacilli bacterium]|nr:hypothetical protein [Bacilli bacterium]